MNATLPRPAVLLRWTLRQVWWCRFCSTTGRPWACGRTVAATTVSAARLGAGVAPDCRTPGSTVTLTDWWRWPRWPDDAAPATGTPERQDGEDGEDGGQQAEGRLTPR